MGQNKKSQEQLMNSIANEVWQEYTKEDSSLLGEEGATQEEISELVKRFSSLHI